MNLLARIDPHEHKSPMLKRFQRAVLLSCLATGLFASAFAADNPFLGYWELTVPGGAAGWLGVEQSGGQLKASMMWAAGSVEPTASAKFEGDQLVITRNHNYEVTDSSGKKVKKTQVETITAKLSGNKIELTSTTPRRDGNGEDKVSFGGKRTPPMPPTPNLAKVKYGKKVKLFNGKNLEGWRLTDPNAMSGWSAQGGLLVNQVVQEEGKPHKNYGNLRTDREFEDFNLKLETRIAKGGNSGIYLRGIYEIQVADSYGQAPESHGIGAVYSRITPTSNPAKPAGEWQSYDITLVNRHVTVILNGVKIIDNQPMLGCTGGALWSDVSRPGPIYLQGDHTGIEYRNIEIRPVTKVRD
jgi:hypothetical protein